MDTNRRGKDSKSQLSNEPVKSGKQKKKNVRRDLSRSKMAKYSSASLSAHQVFKDLKVTASKHISSVKSHFDSILSQVSAIFCLLFALSQRSPSLFPQKLRLTSTKEGNKKYCYSEDDVWYAEFENEPRTPIKLYSPFGIETPSPSRKAEFVQKNRKARPFQR